MISVVRKHVPEYLQKGSFYEALDTSDAEGFEVPSDCLKPHTHIESTHDLKHLLQSLRFWGVEGLPGEILRFVVRSMSTEECQFLPSQFPEYGDHLSKIVALKESDQDSAVSLAVHLKLGVEVVSFLHEEMGYKIPVDSWKAAAYCDDVSVMVYLDANKVPRDTSNVVKVASVFGSIKCLQYVHHQGWKISVDALHEAARHGELNCARYLHEQCGISYTSLTMMFAAESGNLDVIRYLHESGCSWDEDVCAMLASSGSLNCLKYVHEKGCPWTASTCCEAAGVGSLQCLEYAHLQGCAWDSTTLLNAAIGGHLDCMIYAHARGCPMHLMTAKLALQNGSWRCLWYPVCHGGVCYDVWMVATLSVSTGVSLLTKLYYKHHSIEFKDWGLLMGQALQLVEHAAEVFQPQVSRYLCLSRDVQEGVKSACSLLSGVAYLITLYLLFPDVFSRGRWFG